MLSFLKTGTILEYTIHNTQYVFPVLWSLFSFPDVQNQFVQARGEFNPAMFSEFCRYTTHSRVFTFVCCVDGIQQFFDFRFFIKRCNVWSQCSGVQDRAVNPSSYVK